jgi:type I restriction enzyme, R subunit
MKYDIVAQSRESTVVAEYNPPEKRETYYQSEAALEQAFIRLLQAQAYEYLIVTSEAELIANLRRQLEELNDYRFSDAEWQQLFEGKIANRNNGIEEKTAIIQEDHVQLLSCDDGQIKNIYLIDKANIHNNRLQVINQYTTEEGQRANRYDVTILVNGLPMVHIELKRRGVELQEAFNQINRYSRESFWAGSGLFEYIQIFVISNGTYSKYYSNTTRFCHIKEQSDSSIKKGKRSSNSYEFTSWWADAKNRPITDLMDFGKTFFARHTLLSLITRYCVFTSDKQLLAMRPYQIAATEQILQHLEVANNYKSYGKTEGGGYVWHTTGSGKTLTSFKTAQLASKLPYIDKVLFVVDRKDLDYQTMKEYDKFERGAANSNSSTAVLKKQLEDPDSRIIITTIQKLARLINKDKQLPVYQKRVVIIFDECHRSQFGDMHTAIIKSFKRYHLFGFTGTPIFSANAGTSGTNLLRTTEQAFGKKLHSYTICGRDHG